MRGIQENLFDERMHRAPCHVTVLCPNRQE